MKHLFNNRKFYDFANSLANSIENRINNYDKSKFDNNTIEALTEQLVEEFKIELPEIKEDAIYQNKPSDTKIRYSGRGNYGRSSSVDGTKYTLIIPFTGDSTMFGIFPSSFLSVLPYGTIESDELKVIYEVPVGQDASRIKADFDNNLGTIKKYLEFLAKDINDFNGKLEPSIKARLERRKDKLDNDDEIANTFGFPIK
jgi:alanine-alpha-ketoisovalerate/valine-pyruvate aminotransferase